MKGITDILREAQNMQGKLAEMQAELARKQIEGSSGAGMVKVIANGAQEIVSIKIEPALIQDGDLEMVEDLVAAACNDALRQSKTMMESEMQRLAGGLNLKGLFGQ